MKDMRRLRSRRARAVAAALTAGAVAITVVSQVFEGPLSYVTVSGRSMEPTLHSGDLVFVLKHSSYGRGDVIAFRVPAEDSGARGLVIHRVTGGTARDGYRTRGDNRAGSDPWRPRPDDVIGKLAFHVPKAGLAPLFLRSPLGLGLAGAMFAFVAASGFGKSPARNPRDSYEASGAARETV